MNELYTSCWYLDVCQQSNLDEYGNCTKTFVCPRYLEMDYLMNSSGIPKAKQKPIPLIPENIDRQVFQELADIKDNIVSEVEMGTNIYLCSTSPGNGKTSWSLKLMMKYFNEIWAGNGFRTRGLFIHVPTFLLKYKNFDTVDKDFEMLKKLLPIVDMVIWDDIGCTSISNYDLSLLTMYIDQRTLAEKTNIYTGNIATPNELDKVLGDRLRSRIWNTSLVFEFRGHDRRKFTDGNIADTK